jgi:hypothetical protein
MSLVQLLKDKLQGEFPKAEIVTRTTAPNGFEFLNVYLEDLEVAIEWKSDGGFGLSCFRKDDPLEGVFGGPDEWFKGPEAVFHRVSSLLLEGRTTRMPSASILEIRHDLGLSQEALSAQLEVTQATYSRMERRSDFKVSSLKRLAAAMGGILKVEILFPNSNNARQLTF